MRRAVLTMCMAIIAGAPSASPAAAQGGRGVILEAAAGIGRGIGGDYVERESAAWILTAAVPLQGGPTSRLALGLAATYVGNYDAVNDICVIDPDGGCLARFPVFLGLTPELIWIRRPGAGAIELAFRAGAGPYATPDRAAVGFHTQVGAGVRLGGHILLGPSVRVTAFPGFEGHQIIIPVVLVGLSWRSSTR